MRFLILCLVLLAGHARAQQQSYIHASHPTSNSLLISAPIYVGEEYGARFEYNLGGGSIALEAIKVGRGEEYNETQVKEDGLSLITEGYEGTVYVSRFSKPWLMGGFYWSLAMGYRQLDARWRRPNSEGYRFANDEDILVHKMKASGFTGHARLGYRYVSERMPVFLGVIGGLRHFENKFEDKPDADNLPTSDDDRIALSRMIMTRPEFGLEMGLVF